MVKSNVSQKMMPPAASPGDGAMASVLVSIIIPSYNGKSYLEDCLFRLSQQTYDRFEVLVVDNGSTDGSACWVRERYPRVKVIENRQNLGFSRAVNQGARASLGDYLVILNNDTEPEAGWLEALVRFAVSRSDFGSCQSKVLLFEDKGLVNTIGNKIFFLGHGWSGGYREPASRYPSVEEVTYCSGASMMIRRDLFEHVGYMDDEEVFMYHDDLDLGWRLLSYGYKNFLVPESVVYHKYRFNRNPGKYYFLEVSRYVCIIKYYQLKTLLVLSPIMLLYEAGLILLSLSGGWLPEKLKADWYIIANFGRLLRKRKQAQSCRKVSDLALSSYFSGSVCFAGVDSPLLRLVNPVFDFYWRLAKKVI